MGSGIHTFLESWHSYFLRNSLAAINVPWEAEDSLSAEETRRVSSSIAAFQLGEYSEGKGLMRLAEDHAGKIGSGVLIDITRLFIREEQNHALLLKRFMDAHGIAPLKSHWTDRVFRRLRKLLDFELSLTVLITAEIIALVYYDALKNCTGSKVLRAVCEKILNDETSHVRYESGLILRMRGARPFLVRRAVSAFHVILFSGTVLVVYFGHREVLGKGGYGFTRFCTSCRREFSKLFGRKQRVYLVRDGTAAL